MQLKDLKKQVNSSIKSISSAIRLEQKKKIRILGVLFILAVFIILGTILFYNIFGLISGYSGKQFSISKTNPILKKAEEAYEKGLLENSAIYYQTYLESDISKKEKTLTNKKLFEISVLLNDYNKALFHLENIEKADSKSFETPLDKIKIFLRTGNNQKALKELEKRGKRYKSSTEYKELFGVYYIITGDYKRALSELEKIPYNKREYSTHKKIIFCYISKNDFENAEKYLEKISVKIKMLDERKYFTETALLKSIVKIFLNKYESAYDETLKLSSKTDFTSYKDILINLRIFLNINLNNSSEMEKIVNSEMDNIGRDKELLRIIGSYFYYNKNYRMALISFERLQKIIELRENDLIMSSNSSYYLNNYQDAIAGYDALLKNYNYKSPGFYKNLSLFYGKIGDFQNEVFYLKEGLAGYSDDLDYYIRLANVYIGKNDWEKVLSYIKEAKSKYKKNKNTAYDNRIDSLYLMALRMTDNKLAEKELLALREKEGANIDFYFSIIKYYIEQKKFTEAKREINSLQSLSLSEDQKIDLSAYNLAMAFYMNDVLNLRKIKNEIISRDRSFYYDKINSAVIEIYDANYDEALSLLDSIIIDSLPLSEKNKVFYLKALSYYLKNNYPISMKLNQLVLDKEPKNKKANYLKSLLSNKQKDLQ